MKGIKSLCHKSVKIDVTLVSRDVLRKIRNWRVQDDESLSLHKYIGKSSGSEGLAGDQNHNKRLKSNCAMGSSAEDS